MVKEGEDKQSKLQKTVISGPDIKTENQERGRTSSESLPTEDLVSGSKETGEFIIKEEKMETVTPTKVGFTAQVKNIFFSRL